MKPSKFFEKYWRVLGVNGKPAIPDISRFELDVMDIAHELNVEPYIRTYRRMDKPRYTVNPIVMDEIQKRQINNP